MAEQRVPLSPAEASVLVRRSTELRRAESALTDVFTIAVSARGIEGATLVAVQGTTLVIDVPDA
jgi:hypothetical protein